MAYQIPKTIAETLEDVARNRLVLPAIQRELVWAQEPERMTRLFDSILRGYPIGTFLFWKVTPELSKQFHFYEFLRDWHERKHRHNDRLHLAEPRELVAILDGQQRLSALNIGLHGSLAHKLPRKRVDSLDAYPRKYLYLNLRHVSEADDDLQYGFEFRTELAASASDDEHWFRVGDIMAMREPGQPIYEYVNRHGLHETAAFGILDRLWHAVHRDGVISYFEEREPSLSKVLDIFIRVNSGGVVLTKSDLLLSIATAQFTERDAREQVHGLVDDLNDTKPGFRFSKDLVLKAGLVLTGISDIGFRVENFTTANMKILDEQWDAVERSLRVAVRLLSSFGFSERTLPAASLLIPLADYIHQRGLDESYVTSAVANVRADRALVRHWAIRTILKPGIWGSGLDQLLRALHQEIANSSGGFPSEAIETAMARRGKSLNFEDELIDDLLDTPYKHKRAFALLTLLYQWVDTRNEVHVDHVFPRSLATPAKLRGSTVSADDRADIVDRIERLPNLQLLHGAENVQKLAQLPASWVASHYPQAEAREAWLAGHDLTGLPDDLSGFLAFYERRREVLRSRLVDLLDASVQDVERAATEAPTPEPLPDAAAIAPAAARRRTAPSATRTRRMFETTLSDLVESGRLPAGSTLRGRHRGAEYAIEVGPAGRLSAGGVEYGSLSQAAQDLTGQEAVNGWTFWATAAGVRVGDLRADW